MELKHYFKQNRKSRMHMAKKLGYNACYLSQVAGGHANPSLKLCLDICTFTNGLVSLQDLILKMNTKHLI